MAMTVYVPSGIVNVNVPSAETVVVNVPGVAVMIAPLDVARPAS